MMSNGVPKFSIIASCKSTFAGSATIKFSFLDLAADIAEEIILITDGDPFSLRKNHYLKRKIRDLKIISLSNINSVPGASDLFAIQALANENMLSAMAANERGLIPVLWASHLFPYGHAALIAAKALRAQGYRCLVIQFPVGSDIWEIGVNFPVITSSILLDKDNDVLATYSEQFANEIADFYRLERDFFILPPYLRDVSVQPEHVNRLRCQLGIRSDSVVFLHLSNMRPVKRSQDAVRLVSQIQEMIGRRVTLLMVGPHIDIPKPSNITILDIGQVDEVQPYIALAKFCVNTSVHDSFNVSILECMGAGTIPITTSPPAIASFIKRYEAGYIIERHIPMELAATAANQNMVFESEEIGRVSEFVMNSLTDVAYSERIRENMLLMIKEQFSKEIARDNVAKLFDHLVSLASRELK